MMSSKGSIWVTWIFLIIISRSCIVTTSVLIPSLTTTTSTTALVMTVFPFTTGGSIFHTMRLNWNKLSSHVDTPLDYSSSDWTWSISSTSTIVAYVTDECPTWVTMTTGCYLRWSWSNLPSGYRRLIWFCIIWAKIVLNLILPLLTLIVLMKTICCRIWTFTYHHTASPTSWSYEAWNRLISASPAATSSTNTSHNISRIFAHLL